MKSSDDWSRKESLQLGFQHPQQSSLSLLPLADVHLRDSLVPTSDGTKLVRIRDGQAIVFFFGVRSERPSRLKIAMPSEPEASLTDALTKHGVCAFICAPLINPLNGKTVGPDRERVKALARVSEWNGKDAVFWLEENYLGVQPGDVIADLHTWEPRHRNQSAGELGRAEWFAAIETMEAGSSPPARNDTPSLNREFLISFDVHRGAYQVEKVIVAHSNKPQPAATPQPAPVIALTPPIQQQAPKVHVEDASIAIVRRFMVEHFDRPSHKDAAGYANDCNDPMEVGGAMLSRAAILDTVVKNYARFTRMKETVKSMNVTRLSPSRFEAVCTTEKIQLLNGEGQQTVGVATVRYTVNLTPEGPKIVKLVLGKK